MYGERGWRQVEEGVWGVGGIIRTEYSTSTSSLSSCISSNAATSVSMYWSDRWWYSSAVRGAAEGFAEMWGAVVVRVRL